MSGVGVAAGPRPEVQPVWADRIDRRLAELAPCGPACPDRLAAAWRDALLGPGKRLRPRLIVAVMSDLGCDPQDALDQACAIEMIHAASLILDDLPCMDDALMRRGRPAHHVIYGESVSILTAIALLNDAHGLCARHELHGRALNLILTAAVGPYGLLGGQFRDLHPDAISREAIERTYLQKTGALFVASCRIAGVLAGASIDVMAHLDGFATRIGLAFQLLDDAIDEHGSSLDAGKDVRQDEGVATIATVTSDARARNILAHSLRDARAQLASVTSAGAVSAWLDEVFG